MPDDALVDAVARAIATKEGFYVSETDARRRGMRWPTIAQRLCNPGNLRSWRGAEGKPYPRAHGYVDFLGWARQQYGNATNLQDLAVAEGWRCLKRLVQSYLDGRYHGGRRPSPREMFAVYAPATDHNDPDLYAKFVADRLQIPVDQPFPHAWPAVQP